MILDGTIKMQMLSVKGFRVVIMVSSEITNLLCSVSMLKCVTLNAVGEAILGFGSSSRYIAQGFRCNGTEYGLAECSYSNATEDCHGQHVAGFRCTQGY